MLPSKGFLMLSKPVKKTTHVSLIPSFTPGLSSDVRVCFLSCPSSPFFFLLLFGYPPFESFAMSLEESDDLNIPDAAPVDPILEACALSKFDMHLYKSSLNESHVKYLVKLYGIPEDLHPWVVPEGMTMNALPPGVIGLYAHHFQQRGLRVPFSSFFLKVIEHFCVHISQLVLLGVNRVIFFEMYCRSLDITPTVPLFRVFYKLCKQGNWFSFQNRTGKDCKPCLKDAPTSLKKWKDKFFLVDWRAAPVAMAWRHHDSSVADPFPRPSEYNASDIAKLSFQLITMAEFLRLPNFKGCKVSAETLLPPGAARMTHPAPPAGRLEDIPPKTSDMMVAELPCRKVLDDKEKKRKAEEKAAAKIPAVNILAEIVVNNDAGREGPHKKRQVRARPQVHLDSEHVSYPTPLNHVKPLEALANEEHVSLPLSVGHMDTLRDQTDEHATPRVVYASKPVIEEGGQGNVGASHAIEGHCNNEGALSGLQTRPGPTHHSGQRFDTVEEPAPENIVPDVEASYSAGHFDVKSRYKECKKKLAAVQSALEELEEEKKEADQLNSLQADRIKQLEEALKQSEADAHQLRTEKECYAVEADRGEMVRQRIINQYLPTFVRRLHHSAEYKRSLGEVFILVVGKGFMDGISIGREDADVQAILKATLRPLTLSWMHTRSSLTGDIHMLTKLPACTS
ncbi:hypothetical protein Tco_1571536 [Tanacetum coccineum]